MTERFKADSSSLLQFKQRLGTDIGLRLAKFENQCSDITSYLQRVENQNVSLRASVTTLLEASMIDSLLQGQEHEDRKSLGLLGLQKNSDLLGKNVPLEKQVFRQPPEDVHRSMLESDLPRTQSPARDRDESKGASA